MFLTKSRKGASFIIMVIIMAVVMSGFAIALSLTSTSRGANLVSKNIEKQLLYLAQDAVNQMLYKLNTGAVTALALTTAPEVGPLYKYEASYDSTQEPFGLGSGTITGKAYLMSAADPNNVAAAVYAKTIYYAVKAGGSGNPLMTYIKTSAGAQNVPFYRVWNATAQAWGPELQANPCASGIFTSANVQLQFITLTFDPGSAKAMLTMEDNMGNIWAEQWDGGSTWSAAALVYNGGTTTVRPFFGRSFSLAYETTKTGTVNRALLVFADKRATLHVPYYSIWDGTTWATPVTVSATVPTTGQPYYIEVASNPATGSKAIGLIYQDSTRSVYGEVWTGTSWSNMGTTQVWSTNIIDSNYRAIALAYEQVSNRLMFAYSDRKGQVQLNYLTWDGTTLTYDTGTGGSWKQSVQWLQLVPVPGTNQMLAVYTTGVAQGSVAYGLYTDWWNGTAWTGGATSQGTVYGNYTMQYFDVACSGAAKATLIYSTGASTLLCRRWSGSATWAAATTLATSWTRSYGVMLTTPALGNILTAFYAEPAAGNLVEYHTNSTLSWQARTNIFTGLTLTPPYERLAIANPLGSGYNGVPGTWRENY